MDSEKEVLERIRIPTRIVVRRTELTPNALADIVRTGTFTPANGAVCELEAGGKVIARGRIVRWRGEYFFKVRETAKEERS
jgi:hypothetical protein